eukprot:CAMPEP_0202482090 /NCGR_PEP_ID=MMETSP1361-20130828/1538_1 /ASSEMBLY_ACC=CAM_ASM_000849 /TAXON_ID=210615 /ORGANISM="Staurosira complex sp., Strain CCMP2646" /LENGTH=211 /DNA_ID=CAMNT_0049109827 /DNA_START=365 /DNA_END=1001 /DNA_ORIENTATION=+
MFGVAREWELHDDMDSDGSVALQAWTGKYLRARPNGDAKADCNHVGDWESKRWCLNNMSMFLALPSWHGKYLICDNLLDPGQFERADRNGIHEWAIVNNDNALVEPAHSLKCVIGASSISTGVPAGAPVSLAQIAVRLLMDSVLKASAVTGSLAAGAFYGRATTAVFSVLQLIGATLVWVPVAGGGVMAIQRASEVLMSFRKRQGIPSFAN